MELVIGVLKYAFVIALGVEALLIGRALFNLARDKAHEAAPQAPAPPAEE